MGKTATIEELLTALTENLSAEDILAADKISRLSNAIVRQRLAMGLNQSELARKIGKTQSTVSKWENGDMNFTVELLADIAVKLDMDLNVELKPRQVVQRRDPYRSINSKVIDFNQALSKSYSSSDFEALEM